MLDEPVMLQMTCLFLIQFTHKITRLSWVWRSRLQVTQNLWQLVLQQYTDVLVNHDIFCHDMNTDFPTIFFPTLWYCDTSWRKKIRHSEITIFYDSLPKPKPFVKQRDPCMQGKEVPLYCFVCFRSPIFQDGSTKICAVPISCQLTQSCATADKTHGLFVFHSISSQDCLKMSSRKNWHRSRTGSHCH